MSPSPVIPGPAARRHRPPCNQGDRRKNYHEQRVGEIITCFPCSFSASSHVVTACPAGGVRGGARGCGGGILAGERGTARLQQGKQNKLFDGWPPIPLFSFSSTVERPFGFLDVVDCEESVPSCVMQRVNAEPFSKPGDQLENNRREVCSKTQASLGKQRVSTKIKLETGQAGVAWNYHGRETRHISADPSGIGGQVRPALCDSDFESNPVYVRRGAGGLVVVVFSWAEFNRLLSLVPPVGGDRWSV